MTVVVAVLAGALLGVGMLVPIPRVPAKTSLRARPYPEVRQGLRTPTGPLVVVANAALWGALADRFDGSWVLPAYLVGGAALVVLSAIDLRTYLLPNRIVFPLAGVTPVLLAVGALGDGDADPLLRALLGGVVAFVAFLVLHLVSPRSMGFGDVKLSFVLGLLLGYLGWDELLLGLFLGFFYGAVIGLVLIALRLRTRRDHVPFGPFLAAGTITMILAGSALLDWYRP